MLYCARLATVGNGRWPPSPSACPGCDWSTSPYRWRSPAVLGLIEWSWERARGHQARMGGAVLAMNAVAPVVGAIAGILVYFAYNGQHFRWRDAGERRDQADGVAAAMGAGRWVQLRSELPGRLADSRLRLRAAGRAGGLRLCRSDLVVRPPFQGLDRPAAVGLPRVRVQAWRSATSPSSLRPFSPCIPPWGIILVISSGVSDDGADCSRTILRRHSLHSPFHRAAIRTVRPIFCAWALPLSARSSCLQRRISPLRSGWLTRRAGQPSANGRLLLI